jgi:hypothetical protein
MNKTILLFTVFLVLISSFVAAACGDHICQKEESPDTCPSDCQVSIMDYGSCLLDQNVCAYPTMYFHAKNVLIVVFVISVVVFLKVRKFI